VSDWLAEELPLPAPRKRGRVEHTLQCAVVQYLRLACPDGVAFAVPNGGHRSPRVGADLRREGLLAGVPDLCLIWRGRALFIELKTPVGGLSRAQRAVHRALVAAGAEVMVCRSLDQVEASLREAGVRLSATCLGRAA
jgi:hypothetical protein